MNAVLFSSKDTNWRTPVEVFTHWNKIFQFEIDVCASEKNALCSSFFSAEDSCLLKSVANKRCWMNPPYGNPEHPCIQPFEKCKKKICAERGYHNTVYVPGIRDYVKWASEQAASSGALICSLLPARTAESWWHDYVIGDKSDFVQNIKGRLKYLNDDGKTITTAPFPSAIVIWGLKYKTIEGEKKQCHQKPTKTQRTRKSRLLKQLRMPLRVNRPQCQPLKLQRLKNQQQDHLNPQNQPQNPVETKMV